MKSKIIPSLQLIRATVFILSLPFAALSAEIIYQTGFETPAFTAGLPIRGQDNWEMYSEGEAISVSTNNAHTGTQCLRFAGALLEQFGPNAATALCYSRALEALTNNPPAIVEITASVRLDGPQTGANGTPEQDILSANLLAVVPMPGGQGELLGGFFVSSAGKIFTYSRVPEDNYKYSVPYTFGTYRTLTLRVDFIARRMTWIVDGVTVGSGSFLDTISAERLVSGNLYLSGPLEPINTPELTYDMANYTAYFDDYSLNSVLAEGPTILVEQPTGTRLANGASTIDFGNSLVGTPSPRVVALRNAGNAPIQGVTVTLEGAHAAEFALTAPPSGTVEPGGSASFTITFTPAAEGTRSATLRISSSDPDDNPFSVALTGRGRTPAEIVQQAYVKSSNTGIGDFFGSSVAISGDTMVVGAGGEDSNATGVNGNQNSNTAPDSGAAYVFVRDETNWIQQAYLKASNAGANDGFGGIADVPNVTISGDTIVVGAPGEASSATGVNGDQANNTETFSGAAYVFVREGTNWTQQAYLKASNTGAGHRFGQAMGISGDTIVVGAAGGGPYVFVRKATNWTQQAILTKSGNSLGMFVAISGDTIVAAGSGGAYVFGREGTNWIERAYLKASKVEASDIWSVAISGDTVVLGAVGENSTGNGFSAGAAYVFVRDGTNWIQQAYLKASNTQVGDAFGLSVAVSGDAIVVGAPWEDSNARGVNGTQNNNSAMDAGAAYVFVRDGTNWTQRAYLKASNTEASITSFENAEEFGWGVAISGNRVVVGSPREDSNARGVNGNQSNNNAQQSGAAYVFAGTTPSIAEAPRITSIARENGGITLSVVCSPGASYLLQHSENLVDWTDLTTQTATANTLTFADAVGAPRRFYRVKQN